MERHSTPPQPLTEQRIKELALSFFKKHYLDRYANELDLSKGEEATAPGPGLVARLDQVLPGDIFVDGEIRFLRKDGRQFVATFEATDKAKAGELYFKFQKWLLLWDGLATASMITLTVLAVSHAVGILPFDRWGLPASVLVVAAETALLALIYVLLMRHRSRYRYIYAIEQFKRYEADEHWVVFAEEIFEGEQDPRFLELRTQAVREGVGLLQVSPSGQLRVLFLPRHITPAVARHEARVARKPAIRAMRRLRHLLDRLYRLWPWRPDSRSYLRFRKSYVKQIGITAFAALGMSVIISKNVVHKPPRTLGKKERERLARRPTQPEPPDYLVDTPFLAHPFPERPSSGADGVARRVADGRAQVVFYNNRDRVAFADCARFAHIADTVWLVTDTWFDTYEEATQQLEFWAGEGQEASLIWAGCLQGYEPHGFLVFLGGMYPDEARAQQAAARLEARFLDRQSEALPPVFDLLPVKFAQ